MATIILGKYTRSYLSQYLDVALKKQAAAEKEIYKSPKVTWAKQNGIKLTTVRMPESDMSVDFLIIGELSEVQQTEFLLRF